MHDMLFWKQIPYLLGGIQMSATVNKSKLYDAAKCLTTILVVIAHATTMYTPNGAISVANESAILNHFTKYIYAFHMPLFVLLSGCVFGYCIEQNKYTKILPFVLKKGKKLLIPYLAFGIFYVAPTMCVLNLTNAGYINYIIQGIVLSHNSRHLWYILALFWIFLIFILLRPLLVKGIPELAVVGCISLLIFAGSKTVPGTFQLQAACNYQVFFFLGILFNRFYGKFDRLIRKCYALGLLLPFALLMMFFYNPNYISAFAYKLIGTGMIIILCWSLLHRFPAVTDHPLYRAVKKNSFGIYLFHPMIIYVLFHLLGQYDIDPVLLSTMIWVAATILSVFATKLVRKLRLQLVIGE